jgi:hypothetical protein
MGFNSGLKVLRNILGYNLYRHRDNKFIFIFTLLFTWCCWTELHSAVSVSHFAICDWQKQGARNRRNTFLYILCVPDEEHLHMEQLYRTLHTQAIVTTTWALWTSWPHLIHGGPYNIAARSIVTHVQFVVPPVGSLVPCKPAANLIRIGPHYLGVVTSRVTEPVKEIYV